MANNYDQATVQPNFPILSVTDFEKELLSQFGFSYEIYDSREEGNSLYFFVEECTRDEIDDLDVDLVFECAQQGDPIATNVLRYIQNHSSNSLDTYVSSEFSWVSIFQEILKKPECEGIEDICVEGAYTCDKLRPGEFGGWVCRITRDSVQCDGTSAAFERMKKEPEFLAALNLVLEMASGNPLDELDVYDDSELAADFKRQHHALDVIHEYLVLHPIAN
jgi:hypothetical protein